jgi:dienelactone hydrolase
LPAILLVHGGGGGASLARGIAWSKRGYAVLAIDLPGKGDKRSASRSGGPNMDVPILLRTRPDLTYNYLVHAVAATRNGINYLCQRKEVDTSRIGMVGLSWGGVITLLTNGQDDRLKTAVNVFGAGYIPEGCTWQTRFDQMSREDLALWDTYIDPKLFLKTQHAPILFLTGTNDHCYYLPTFQKSFAEVTAEKQLLLIPNLRHRFLDDTQSFVWQWLDNHLKNNRSFPEVALLPFHLKEENKLVIPVKASSLNGIKDVKLYYAKGTPSGWTQKRWQSLKPYTENGIFYFPLPFSMIDKEMLIFATAKDKLGGAASTPVQSIFCIKLPDGKNTYALSAPIKQINYHPLPLQLAAGEVSAEAFQLYYSPKSKTYSLVEIKKSSLPNLTRQ